MRKLLVSIILFLSVFGSDAAVLSLSLQEAEMRLQNSCVELMARRFDIDEAEARVIQARLFDNPVVSVEQNVYNSLNGRYFDMGREGEFIIEIEQRIDMAWQRGKRVRIEKKNKQVAEQEFEEVVRTLRSSMRKDFVLLYFSRLSAQVYEWQISSLESLSEAVGLQVAGGNVPLYEKLRIETMLLSLRRERQSLCDEATTLEEGLRLLLGVEVGDTIEPSFEMHRLYSPVSSVVTLDSLLSLLPHRPDVMSAGLSAEVAELDLKLQRAQAWPEVSVKATYDKAGNFINNYWAVGASVSVPIFNRNQGGIQAARTAIGRAQRERELARGRAESELRAAYSRLVRAEQIYDKTDFSLVTDYAAVIEGVSNNYQRRNISLLEFVDYYEGYTAAVMNVFEVEQELVSAMEAVNDIVNKRVFNIK